MFHVRMTPNMFAEMCAIKAPGTFGYDPTKYRKRYSANMDHIPMDEFGQKPELSAPELTVPSQLDPRSLSQPSTPIQPHSPQSYNHSNGSRAESPPPFAHYARDAGGPSPQMQTKHPLPAQQPPRREHQVEEEESGGCCKCVIM